LHELGNQKPKFNVLDLKLNMSLAYTAKRALLQSVLNSVSSLELIEFSTVLLTFTI